MIDMKKREEIIKGLERCAAIHQGIICECCVYPGVDCAVDDAIALLKAQEPRVMTLEEVNQERICWIEDADDGMTVRLFPATMFGIGKYANGSKSCMFLAHKPWAIDEHDCEWWYLIEDYGKIWRCWTSRPTDEQMEAIPWN